MIGLVLAAALAQTGVGSFKCDKDCFSIYRTSQQAHIPKAYFDDPVLWCKIALEYSTLSGHPSLGNEHMSVSMEGQEGEVECVEDQPPKFTPKTQPHDH